MCLKKKEKSNDCSLQMTVCCEFKVGRSVQSEAMWLRFASGSGLGGQ